MQYIVNHTKNTQKLIFDENGKIISKKHIDTEKLQRKTPIISKFEVREMFAYKFKNKIVGDIQYLYSLINFIEYDN